MIPDVSLFLRNKNLLQLLKQCAITSYGNLTNFAVKQAFAPMFYINNILIHHYFLSSKTKYFRSFYHIFFFIRISYFCYGHRFCNVVFKP